MKRDPLLWGALVAVLVVLASAEYELARACGFGTYVAAGVPAALDIYAVKALRSKRDVPLAVIALIAVNAASHLVASGLLPVDWPLIVAVSAIAPLVLWRVHRLSEEPAVAQTATVATPTGGVAPAGANFLDVIQEVPARPAADRYGVPVVRPTPEPIYAAPEPAEPAAEPITVERAPEPADAPPQAPVLGAFVPVAELMGGTTPDVHGDHFADVRKVMDGPTAEPAEPPVSPAVPPHGSGAADIESEDTSNTSFGRYVADARNWLTSDPTLTGTAIGTRLGKSDAYGRRVRRAALAELART